MTLRTARILVLTLIASRLLTPVPTSAAQEHSRRLTMDTSGRSATEAGGWAMPGGSQAPRSDTLQFGSVGTDGFAIMGEAWTWDHGGPDPLEGWYATDLTTDERAFFRHITADIWANGDGGGPTENEVPAPILRGSGSLWVGAFENEADDLCWDAGLGYDDAWCQRAFSPVLTWDGASSIDLSLVYFNDTEPNFDYNRVIQRRISDGEEIALNSFGFSGQYGLASNHPVSPPVGASYDVELNTSLLSAGSSFQIVFEFASDGGWSDEDGQYVTEYGPFGLDDVALTGGLVGGGVSYAFEFGLDGWTVAPCLGTGSFLGVAPLASYVLEDPCDCELSGNVLEMHDVSREHPYPQLEVLRSNPVNVARDVLPNLSGPGTGLAILAEFDQYADLPRSSAVFYRTGWQYFPYLCPATGEPQWSDPVFAPTYYYGGDQVCSTERSWAMPAGVPEGIEQIRFVYELYASCDAFDIPQQGCTATNFSPLLDNAKMLFTRTPHAPEIDFPPGMRFQDTFPIGDLLDPNAAGRADVVLNLNPTPHPFVRGDSLCVAGPLATSSTRWEARLWFRLASVGPGSKPPRYNSWKNAVSDGRDITSGEFTYAWMDSFELGALASRNKFVSYLRETGEDDYNWDGGGEQSDANEIIRDDVLIGGSQVEYFITANYTATPGENFLLPDTTGGNFAEFAILPTWTSDWRFPCLLYVAGDPDAVPVIEAALASLGIEHDRYDYLDAASNWKAPMGREFHFAPRELTGADLGQVFRHKTLLVSTGSLNEAFWPEDFGFFSDWATFFFQNTNRQALLLNGDNVGEIVTTSAPAFAYGGLGLTLTAPDYGEWSGDESECVELDIPSSGGFFATSNSHGDYEAAAWGNGCPQPFGFDVLGTANGSVGNRSYYSTSGGTETSFAQVARRADAGVQGNFRAVIDAVSYHHLVEPAGSGDCVVDSSTVTATAVNELLAALEWIFGAGGIPGLCNYSIPSAGSEDHLSIVADPRWLPSGPSPFESETSLRFALPQAAEVRIEIFDASGRRVRVLVDEPRAAGTHEVKWDGRDGAGHYLPAGVYWSQLGAGGHRFSRKLVILE